jgi:hypothetical protein
VLNLLVDEGFLYGKFGNCVHLQLVAKKKTGTVRIKLTPFYNFLIVRNLLTRDRLELTSKFNDIFKNYLIGIVK